MTRKPKAKPKSPEATLTGCIGKLGYGSKAEADRVCQRVVSRREEGQSRLSAYHCRNCGQYHLGRRGFRINPLARRTTPPAFEAETNQ